MGDAPSLEGDMADRSLSILRVQQLPTGVLMHITVAQHRSAERTLPGFPSSGAASSVPAIAVPPHYRQKSPAAASPRRPRRCRPSSATWSQRAASRRAPHAGWTRNRYVSDSPDASGRPKPYGA